MYLLIRILICFLPILASSNEALIEGSQLPVALQKSGLSCVDCIFHTTGEYMFGSALEPPLDGEKGFNFRVHVIRSEVYHSLVIELIRRDDSVRPKRFIQESYYLRESDIAEAFGLKNIFYIEFLEWVSPTEFRMIVQDQRVLAKIKDDGIIIVCEQASYAQ